MTITLPSWYLIACLSFAGSLLVLVGIIGLLSLRGKP